MFMLDRLVTHTKNFATIDVAMVSLPPHTTHRFQPLGGAFSDRLGNTTMMH